MNPWPYPIISAHRGGGTLAPENTLAAMRYAVAHGFRGVEFDVMLSQDQMPVLMHDPWLGRTVSGAGCIADYSAATLQTLDVGAWHSPAYQGEPIPRLREVLQYGKQQSLWMNVEIKPVPGYEATTGEITARMTAEIFAELLQGTQEPHLHSLLPLLSSFSVVALQAAQRAVSALPRGMLYETIPDTWQEQLNALQCVSLHCNQHYLTPERVKEIKQAGYWVFVYTVNDLQRARELFDWGVDGMVTDRLDVVSPAVF